MTNEQQKAKELAELLTAFADGKQLQYESDRFGWCATTSLGYIADSVIDNKRQIRIKPETKRIALNQQDLIDRELSGKTMRIQYGTAEKLIVDWDSRHVFLSNYEMSYEEMKNYKWLDNSPCYKEVECER